MSSNNCQHQHTPKPSDEESTSGNTNPVSCICSNISIMQLFHELKAKFPTIPDHIVSQHCNKYYHDRDVCISLLSQEQARLPRGVPYPPDLMRLHRKSLDLLPSNICTTTASSTPITKAPCNNHQNNVNLMLMDTKENLNRVNKSNDENTDVIKNESSSRKFIKKVGKFAERITKKSDKRNKLVRQRNLDEEDSIITKSDKTKSQSLECLLTQTPQELSSSLQNLSLDSNPLTKSTRLTNFHKKPPIPPEIPKRPTTLIDPSMKVKTPFTLPPSEVRTPSVNINVNVDVVQSPNRTVLTVDPELGWLTPQSPRSYTSVNLTLRTPTSEPQSPIDINTSNAGLTYSSSSYDPRKGFQSSVQITVAPAGGTVSAGRIRPRSSYIPDNNNESPNQGVSQRTGSLPDLATSISNLIKRQLEKKERLRIELIAERRKLYIMQQDVATLETLPKQVNTSSQLIEETRLRREIRQFQVQCDRLADEVDRRSYSRAPLGETNEEFYQNIYTGQRIQLQNLIQQTEQSEGGPPWTCDICTFSNHPLLNNCEECGMMKDVRRGTTTDTTILDKHFLNPPPSSQIIFKNNNLTTCINNNNSTEV